MTSVDLSVPRDVVVAGGGNAALCAAIAAREAGASVLVLEAAPQFYRGGNTRHTRNIRLAHTAANGIVTGPYTEEEYWDDLLRVTKGETDEQLARMAIARSPSLWDFYVERGVRFQPPMAGTLVLGRTNASFLGGGRAMLNALYRHAEKIGVEIAYEAEVVSLHVSGRLFRSAAVRRGSVGHVVVAKNLIAASGGYE